ncbi:MAG: peptidase DmpA, partial [Bryobacterales bacterium]|nr:peptidase DmpA [Bryobacterales bacterium]
GGVDVRGSATGSCELETLDPGHVAANVDAIVLAGGSAFGLEAASGVRRILEKQGIGFQTGVARVPIVPGAILFDLGIGRADVRPGLAMGEKAVLAATDAAVAEGNVGAGTGATVGKILGMRQAMKSGIGTFSLTLGNGVIVAAMVAVNALGDVIDPATGKVVAGARKSPESREFVGSATVLRHGVPEGRPFRGNTTLAIIATNAALDKVQINKVAAMASLGVGRTISPVNTMSDGDITFAIARGAGKASVNAIGTAAAEALAEAVLRAVRSAKTAGGIPGLAG